MTEFNTLVLVVEDDSNFARLVMAILGDAGYGSVHYTDANAAVEWLKEHRPELIITDIGLPGISGIQLCKILKAEQRTTSIPVIVLSALNDEADKVAALRSGADDYVVKPFSGNELLARIEALLRRTRHDGVTGRLLADGALELDLDSGEAALSGRQLGLLPKEYALLALLLMNKGKVLTYRYIEEAVWGLDSIATRDTIKVTVYRLRGKLGPYAACIASVQGIGYRWIECCS
ncbi:MAG: response regulator transcription factor [Elusimicrobiales bacterium]